jgi:hypothetical protein
VKVVAGLEDHRAELEFPGQVQAVQDVVHGQAVTVKFGVGPAQTAVAAVLVAVVGEFDDAADVDFRAEILPGQGVGGGKQTRIVDAGEQCGDF